MDVPTELKSHIAMFCTRGSLASLARVHTSYQQESERALYQSVAIQTASDEITCLETLSSNPRKASLVWSLIVDFPYEWDDDSESFKAAIMLSDVLPCLCLVSDLRIRLPTAEACGESLELRLNSALRFDSFRLRTLYCNDYLDINGVILAQSTLQFLGIYANGGDSRLLDSLRDLTSPILPTLTAITLQRESYLPFYNHLSIFPTLSSGSSVIFKNCSESFQQDASEDTLTSEEHVSQVSIFLDDFHNTPLVLGLVKDMSRFFPNVSRLNFMLRNPSEIVGSEVAAILSSATELRELWFNMWDFRKDETFAPSTPRKIGQAKAWAAVCPHLSQVAYWDGVALERNGENWEDFGP